VRAVVGEAGLEGVCLGDLVRGVRGRRVSRWRSHTLGVRGLISHAFLFDAFLVFVVLSNLGLLVGVLGVLATSFLLKSDRQVFAASLQLVVDLSSAAQEGTEFLGLGVFFGLLELVNRTDLPLTKVLIVLIDYSGRTFLQR